MLKKISLCLGYVILYTLMLPFMLLLAIYYIYSELVVKPAFKDDGSLRDSRDIRALKNTLKNTYDKGLVKHNNEVVTINNINVNDDETVWLTIENEKGFNKRVSINDLELETPSIDKLDF